MERKKLVSSVNQTLNFCETVIVASNVMVSGAPEDHPLGCLPMILVNRVREGSSQLARLNSHPTEVIPMLVRSLFHKVQIPLSLICSQECGSQD